MAIITVDQLTEFMGKYPDEDATLPSLYVGAAEDCIVKYLGYSPEFAEYTDTLFGDNSTLLSVFAPIVELKSVNGSADDLDSYSCRKNHIRKVLDTGCLATFSKGNKYVINYTGGYETIPSAMVICALQIASLLWESAGGNLAVSSTSFADTGTRVFNNYKIERFLESINEYRCYNG